MYRVNEKDISATVNDFMVFIDYIDEKKPILSKRKAILGKNDLYEINSLLHYKKEVLAPNYNQESYPVIDLMFKLALLGKLYVNTADSKGKVHLTRTERKGEFDALNIYEKYAFLLETFWIRYDTEDIMGWQRSVKPIEEVIQTFAGSAPLKELEKGVFSHRKDYDALFSLQSVIVYLFNYYGFCSYVPIVEVNKKLTRYDDSIKTVLPTNFGVNICKILLEQNIADWNIPWLKLILREDEKEIVPGITYQSKLNFLPYVNKSEKIEIKKIYKDRKRSGYIPLYKFLQPIFPEDTLNKTVTAVINKDIKGSYVFMVSFGRSVWRKIVLSYKHTLEDLHNAVQDSFEFDNDHLYSFFMDGKRYSKQAYHSPISKEGPFTDEVTIGELELFEGQKFLYLFDYGDCWEFEVQLLKINKDEIPPEQPLVIEVKGEAPNQYGFF